MNEQEPCSQRSCLDAAASSSGTASMCTVNTPVNHISWLHNFLYGVLEEGRNSIHLEGLFTDEMVKSVNDSHNDGTPKPY